MTATAPSGCGSTARGGCWLGRILTLQVLRFKALMAHGSTGNELDFACFEQLAMAAGVGGANISSMGNTTTAVNTTMRTYSWNQRERY